jgi:hypothetical protein
MTNEDIFNPIKDKLSTLLKAYYKLIELKASEKFVLISSKIFLVITGFFILSLTFLLLSIGFSIYLGEILNNKALGYISVAGIYLIIFILMILLRKKLIYPVLRNFITKELYD